MITILAGSMGHQIFFISRVCITRQGVACLGYPLGYQLLSLGAHHSLHFTKNLSAIGLP